MAYELRMSDELHDWLTDLATTDPVSARLLAEALTVLLEEGPEQGAPALALLTDPGEVLDEVYQRCLSGLQGMRRQAADLATTRQRLEEETARKGENPELRRQLDEAAEAEQRMTEKSWRAQTQVDAFRTRKEVLKTRLIATRTQREVHDAMSRLDLGDEEPDESVDFEARLRDIEQEIQHEISQASAAASGMEEAEPSLMELRTGASGDDEIHVLFAVEPPESILVIAVVEGRSAWRDHQGEAISLSAEVLRSAQAGRAPEATTRHYDGPRAFLDEFFPAAADEIEAAAANLTARKPGRTPGP